MIRASSSLLAAITLVALMDFRGCGGDDPAPIRPDAGLHVHEGCIDDLDCPAIDMCTAAICVDDMCVAGGPLVDEDRDGHGPIPCGGDCDDGNAERHPGAIEECNGRDDDCDGEVDEEALGVDERRFEGLSDVRAVVTGGDVLIVGMSGGELAATRGLTNPLARALSPSTSPAAFDLVELDDTALLVHSTESELVIQPIRIEGDAFRLDDAIPLAGSSSAAKLRATTVAERLVVLTESTDGIRRLWQSATGELELGRSTAPLALASDGTHAVIAMDDGLRFYDASGAVEGSFDVPGELVNEPIASGNGQVVVLYRDSFDLTLTEVLPNRSRSRIAAPAGTGGARADRAGVHRMGDRYLVTRVGMEAPAALSAWLLEEDLRRYAAAFTPAASPLNAEGGSVREWASVLPGDLPVVVTERADGGSVTFLQCR